MCEKNRDYLFQTFSPSPRFFPDACKQRYFYNCQFEGLNRQRVPFTPEIMSVIFATLDTRVQYKGSPSQY